MQTPEAGADSTSTVPLQTTVPVQPTGSAQQVPVQQQVRPRPSGPAARHLRVCLFFFLALSFFSFFSHRASQVCEIINAFRFPLAPSPGPDCSTGSACLPSTGAVCGGKQRHLHQWKHVSQSVRPL